MITPSEIEKKTMTADKKISAKNDYFAFYVGRPLSYVLTIPFLYTNISPNMVSLISIIPLIIGFILMAFGTTQTIFLIGWFCFFLWNLLDGVDGNIARFKKQFSKMGSVYDAMSGYAAMVLSFFAWGISAAHFLGPVSKFLYITSETYIILGALSGIFTIFPRLVMHKAITTFGNDTAVLGVKDKSNYGFVKVLALNLTSITGFVQIFMLIAILFESYDLFTLGYFTLNFFVMIVSLRTIFKNKEYL